MTIDDIRNAMNTAGRHWFEPATMLFFQTRCGAVHCGPGGVYFVTSEVRPSGIRRYTVRRFIPATATDRPWISTVGPFCVMTRGLANRAARALANGDKVTADTMSYGRTNPCGLIPD